MTNDEMNIALCEMRGWKKSAAGKNSPWKWIKPNGIVCQQSDLPNHLTGIEALGNIHEVEKLLTDEQWKSYIWHLRCETAESGRVKCSGSPLGYEIPGLLHATPIQKATAILRATGRYKEAV